MKKIIAYKFLGVNKFMERNDSFWRELNEGNINFRDDYQFELKSEFILDPANPTNTLTQEFYIFIPNSLQVNDSSYPKEFFWLDETNLIRYKTPKLSFEELNDPKNKQSPFVRIEALKPYIYQPDNLKTMMDEWKMLGNILRSSLRYRVREIVNEIDEHHLPETICKHVQELVQEVKATREHYLNLQDELFHLSSDTLFKVNIKHIDEFTSLSIDFFLTGLLDFIQQHPRAQLQSCDSSLSGIINQEMEHREKNNLLPKKIKGSEERNESVLYRMGLLEKFVLEALMLDVYRQPGAAKYGGFVAAFAAGFAMLIYMSLFAWKARELAITSTPFVLLAVVFYILKDRLKEEIKKFYYAQAFRWFPDYSTEILSPQGRQLGKLTESFAFIDEDQLPPGFLAIRNFDFHEELQSLKRHESIIRYKKEVALYHNPEMEKSRRSEINTTFRLNIHHFLEKAHNALQTVLVLEPSKNQIVEMLMPKVYHLNMIIKDTFMGPDQKKIIDIKKFRVVVDKNGIKRVEEL